MPDTAVALQGFRATFAKPELTHNEMQVIWDLLLVNSNLMLLMVALYQLYTTMVSRGNTCDWTCTAAM